MNLNDLAPKLDSKKLSEAYNSQFGKKVNAAAVSHEAAVRMLRETRERIAWHGQPPIPVPRHGRKGQGR